MARVKTNVIANLIGQGWTALLQIALVPFYLHFLGVESYALINVYVISGHVGNSINSGNASLKPAIDMT